MELVEVSDILMGTSGDEVALRMDSNGRVVTFVGEERGYSGSSVRSIVVSKFSQREESTPVILLVVGIHTEVLLQCLVDPFGLTIAFRVVTGGEMQLHIQSFP